MKFIISFFLKYKIYKRDMKQVQLNEFSMSSFSLLKIDKIAKGHPSQEVSISQHVFWNVEYPDSMGQGDRLSYKLSFALSLLVKEEMHHGCFHYFSTKLSTTQALLSEEVIIFGG